MRAIAGQARVRSTLAWTFVFFALTSIVQAKTAAPDTEATAVAAAHERAKAAVAEQEYDAARQAYGDMLAKLYAEDAKSGKRRIDLEATAYMELGVVDDKLGRLDDAISDYNQAMALGERSKTTFVVRYAQQQLERLYWRNGDYDLAAQTATAELHTLGTHAPPTAQLAPMIIIARCDAARGRWQEAKAGFDKAWDLAERADYVSPEQTRALLEASTAVYRQLQLDDLAQRAEKRAAALNQKFKAAEGVLPQSDSADTTGDTSPSFIGLGTPGCKPSYPPEAMAKPVEGTVVLTLKVSRDGTLTEAILNHSSGSSLLDDATIKGLGSCKFRPATHGGQPADGEFEFSYAWKLD